MSDIQQIEDHQLSTHQEGENLISSSEKEIQSNQNEESHAKNENQTTDTVEVVENNSTQQDIEALIGSKVNPTEKLEEETSAVNKVNESVPEEKKEILAQPIEEPDLSLRLASANELKDSAKFFVKGGNYGDAIKIYESAFHALRPTARDRAHPEFKKCLLLQVDLFNNLSFCYEQLERYQEALAFAKKVLIFEENVKAMFRIASIYKKLGQNLEAFDQVKKCVEVFKRQNPDLGLDPKIHELYLSLKESCKEDIQKRDNKEKEIYSKMLGSSKDKVNEVIEKNSTNNSRKIKDSLSWKPVRYGLYLGPTIILGIIAARIAKQKSIEVAKNHAPAILTAVGAILVLTYIKNHVRKSVLGLGLATAAALMIQRTSKTGFWKAN